MAPSEFSISQILVRINKQFLIQVFSLLFIKRSDQGQNGSQKYNLQEYVHACNRNLLDNEKQSYFIILKLSQQSGPMYKRLGDHYIKKYNHTLIINSVYDDTKPSRQSQVFTSASSRPSREMSFNKNLEQLKKKHKNYLFSPQISLERYRSKVKCDHNQNARTNGESDIKLIISVMNQSKTQARRWTTPFKQFTRESTFCSHCQNREKQQKQKKQRKANEQQNANKLQPLYKDTSINVKINEVLSLEHQDKPIYSSLRGSTRRSIQENKKNLLHLPVEVKPWQMNASDSSI